MGCCSSLYFHNNIDDITSITVGYYYLLFMYNNINMYSMYLHKIIK